IRDRTVTGVQTCALPICRASKEKLKSKYALAGSLCVNSRVVNDVSQVVQFLFDLGLVLGELSLLSLNFFDQGKKFLLLIRVRSRSEERRVGKECGSGWLR